MRTILLSFEPDWFSKLEEGKVKFEYRKNLPDESVKVYFYVSSPVKAISGIAIFGQRENLIDWKKKYQSRGPEVVSRIDDYLTDCRYVVPITQFQKTSSIPLSTIRNDIKNFVVPRMYYYIEGSELEQYLEKNLTEKDASIIHDFTTIGNDDICK